MRCVVLKRPREMAVEERPAPRASENDVLIRVKVIGICGSDIHAYRGTQPFQTYPRVLGHELTGLVARSGMGLEAGQAVTVEPLIRCGSCYPCRQGRYNCCTSLKVIGVHIDGGMCEYISVPRPLVYALPEGVPLDKGALCEPLAVACQAIKRSRLVRDETVLIIGAGPIGLLTMQVAASKGASTFITDIDRDRLGLARRLGAEVAIDAGEEDVKERIMELTDGEGPNVVIEAVGSEETILQAIDLVSSAGRVVLLGLYKEDLPFRPTSLIRKELDLLGSRNSSGLFPQALGLIRDGVVDMGGLITNRFPLEEAPEVFRDIDLGRIKPVKALLIPNEGPF